MWETVSHIQEACSQWNLQKVFLYESARTKKNISVLMCSVSFLNLKKSKLCLKRSDHVTWTQTNSYRESPRYSFAYSQCVLRPPADFSLSSPHQPAKTCSLRFFFFFFTPSLSVLSLSVCLHLSAERQLRQTGILDRPMWGGVFLGFLGWGPVMMWRWDCWSAQSCCF